MLTFNEGDILTIHGQVGIIRARNGTLTIELGREYDGVPEEKSELRARVDRRRAKLDRERRIRDTDGAA